MIDIIKKITQDDQIRPRGWKLMELPLLEKSLKDKKGTVLIVGERGSGDGVLATVLENEGISKPVHCIDIQPMGDDAKTAFGAKKIKEGKIKFFHDDLVVWETKEIYDYIVCMNVLEHFGFDQSGDYTKPNYDFNGIAKMFSMCRKNLILSIPHNPFLIGEEIEVGGQIYGDDRIAALGTIGRKMGFWAEGGSRLINVNKSNKCVPISLDNLPPLSESTAHEYLMFLHFTRR